MKQNILKEWIDALRSGEYSQGEGQLCAYDEDDNELFCCLGVLCEIAAKQGVAVNKTISENDGSPVVFYDDKKDFLPDSVRVWAGLNHENPSISYDHENDELGLERIDRVLSEINDEGASFLNIADLLEEEWLVK